MKNTLFVQFYTKHPGMDDVIVLHNGFSDTYDYCKKIGDFHWSYTSSIIGEEQDVKNQCKNIELPIKSGKVYISAATVLHLLQSYYWAKKYPNIKFVVGGPAINTNSVIYDKYDIPKNLNFIYGTVEQFFGIPEFSYSWNIDLPNMNNVRAFYLTYLIDSNCYWGKCKFCTFNDIKRKRKNLNFEFKNLKSEQKKIIFLSSPSISPSSFDNLISTLPKNIVYGMFYRIGKQENKVLKYVTKKHNMDNYSIQIGVDFLSNRVLEFMGKGYTTDDILETIPIVNNSSGEYYFSFIYRWPNIVKQDVIETEKLAKHFPSNSDRIKIKLWPLLIRSNTPLYHLFKDLPKSKVMKYGPFLVGFFLRLSKKEKNLTREIKRIIWSIQNKVTINYKEIKGA